MNLAIRQFEELSWDLELDIYELDDIIANHMTVSRRYAGCKDVEYIDNVPHLHQKGGDNMENKNIKDMTPEEIIKELCFRLQRKFRC